MSTNNQKPQFMAGNSPDPQAIFVAFEINPESMSVGLLAVTDVVERCFWMANQRKRIANNRRGYFCLDYKLLGKEGAEKHFVEVFSAWFLQVFNLSREKDDQDLRDIAEQNARTALTIAKKSYELSLLKDMTTKEAAIHLSADPEVDTGVHFSAEEPNSFEEAKSEMMATFAAAQERYRRQGE